MNLTELSNKRLIAYIQARGKTANQRLVLLEKSGLSNYPAYQYISSKISDKLTTTSASGSLKIDIKTRGLSRSELLEKAYVIQRFLEAKTSTVRGINRAFEKSKKKFEEQTGQTYSKKVYGDLWSASVTMFYENLFGSQQIIRWVKEMGVNETIATLSEAYEKGYTTLIDIESLRQEVGDVNFEKSNL